MCIMVFNEGLGERIVVARYMASCTRGGTLAAGTCVVVAA